MHNNSSEVSHIYPYVDDATISVRQRNWDWDNDGVIRIVSTERNGQLMELSGEDEWGQSDFGINDEEKNASLDFQLHKRKDFLVRNNNVVINIRNQYDDFMPFFVIPIGGVPKYKYTIGVKPKSN